MLKKFLVGTLAASVGIAMAAPQMHDIHHNPALVKKYSKIEPRYNGPAILKRKFYVGTFVGESNLSSLSAKVTAPNNESINSDTSKGISYGFAAGYHFNRYFGVEFDSAFLPNVSVNANAFNIFAGNVTVKNNSYYAFNARADYYFNKWFYADFKAGLAVISATWSQSDFFNNNAPSGSKSAVSGYLGGGVGVDLNNWLGFAFDAAYVPGKDDIPTMTTYMGGFIFRM